MLVVEFGIDSPILMDALAHAPGTTVSHEAQYQLDSGVNLLFWAEGEGLESFDDGLGTDPTVTDVMILAETACRRLYRVTFTERGEAVATFPAWSDLDLSFMHATATTDGWDVRMRMPDRDALQGYRTVCEERGISFQLQSMYDKWENPVESDAPLTEPQREALTTAQELGYFEIPRRASLADVATELGISAQSLSERLRRGIPVLVDAVLNGSEPG